MAPETLALALFIIRILSPVFVFLATLSLLTTRPPAPPEPSQITAVVVSSRIPRRAQILSFLSLCSLTFFFDGLSFVIYVVIDRTWPRNTGIEYNTIIGLVAFGGLAALGAWKDVHGIDVWSMKRIKIAMILSLALDIALVVLLGISTKHIQHPPHSPESRFPIPIRLLLHLVFPLFRVLLLVPLTFALLYPRVVYTNVHSERAEEEPVPTASSFLLPPESGLNESTGLSPASGLVGEASKYGTFRTPRSTLHRSTPTTRAPTPSPSNGPETKTQEKPEIVLDPSWSEIFRRLRRLTPYLWPKKSKPLQLLAVICIFIIIVGRFVTAVVPFTLGELVRIFETGSTRSPWPWLFAYVGLRFLQGSGGLAALRDAIWTPVMQYSDREMSQLSFDHLLNLSFAFHTRRKTGEILRILDRGAAINHILELILFNIIPTFIDIIVALVVFCVKFSWTLAVVIFFVMLAYVSASVVLTRWRTKLRRQMNDRDVITRGIHTDCLLNYETVKYFNGEEYEGERYRDALREYQALEYRVILALNLLNLVQNFIITLGLLIGSMIVALRVTRGEAYPSDFVIFITYLAQLYGPLNSLGSIYRSINQSLVDTERLLKLLNEPTEVKDKPNAPDLIVENGEIEFENVTFCYDGRNTALHNISFKVPKGSSVALVGESGAGKSTILRLLYRFYDLGEDQGRILIDGQDIRDVTQASLRKAIGVVPQDSILFNASIGYNIGYGKFGATSEEIQEAAKSAQMHDRITSFPDSYDTKVGERGVRLSGGEKQRVAIARTLLKNPPILLLDEATSALDTSTEKDIQKALQNLVQGRSSLSIAHRLSTIASADLILVLKDGQIVEQGSHKDLLAQDGLFASMWADQVSASDDPAVSLNGQAVKKELSGYLIGESSAHGRGAEAQAEQAHDSGVIGPLVETPEVVSEGLPPTDGGPATTGTDDAKPSAAPVSFPSSGLPAAGTEAGPSGGTVPVAFPSSGDPSSQRGTDTPASAPAAPGVTFDSNVNVPPRTGTPDPESEPKRKGISAQNFQRLARRISLTTRRQGSSSSLSMIPGLKRDSSSPKVSQEDNSARGEGSTRNSNDSPAGSVSGDADKSKSKKEKEKKEKKEKRRKSLM